MRLGGPADISINLRALGFEGAVTVKDVWTGKSLGIYNNTYTANSVDFHDTAFLRLSAA